MFGSQILDVALGMAFLFALLSLIASAVREGGETLLKSRAKELEKGIGELVSDTGGIGVKKWLYDHPSISALFQRTYAQARTTRWWQVWDGISTKLPAYIPSRNFAEALLDLAARGPVPVPPKTGSAADDRSAVAAENAVVAAADPAGTSATAASGAAANPSADAAIAAPIKLNIQSPPVPPLPSIPPGVTLDTVRAGIAANFAGNPSLQRALLLALDDADTLQQARANVEAWYDSAMDRVSGWYKRRTQYWLLIIGLATAVVMNIDSVRVVNALSTNDTLRKTVVAQAEAAAAGDQAPRPFKAITQDVEGLGLPVGWQEDLSATRLCARRALALHLVKLEPVVIARTDPPQTAVQIAKTVADSAESDAEASCLKIPPPADFRQLVGRFRDQVDTGVAVVAERAGNAWIGWLVTAFAISFGAPFWFDVLNKIMIIRSTVKPGEKSGAAPAKDKSTG